MESKIEVTQIDNTVKIKLVGKLDAVNAPELMEQLKKFSEQIITKVYYIADELDYISSAGLRVIIFSKQKIAVDADLYLIGAKEAVLDVITMSGLDNFLIIKETIE